VHVLKEDVHVLKEDVQTLKVSVLSLEQTVGSYADSYKENQRNIKRLDTRLNVVEEELSIEPPEDLKIPHFVA
jgi:predicted  nucleic acid-binding Zn-ribbon protein